MTADGTPRISNGTVAAVLLLVAVYYGCSVLAPLALALFIIAIVWRCSSGYSRDCRR
jgi:predicted PurR-regulated permease PerM